MILLRKPAVLFSSLLSLAALTVTVPRLLSAAPGVGLTSQFEINFLEFTIDHHFSALRMTMLVILDRRNPMPFCEVLTTGPACAATSNACTSLAVTNANVTSPRHTALVALSIRYRSRTAVSTASLSTSSVPCRRTTARTALLPSLVVLGQTSALFPAVLTLPQRILPPFFRALVLRKWPPPRYRFGPRQALRRAVLEGAPPTRRCGPAHVHLIPPGD